MRFKCLTAALACCLFATAQEVTITRHEQLLKGVESGIYNPVLSADGQKVLFTASNYKGLKMYDMQDDVVTRLSDDQMAGFDPVFSRDGKSVYFMSQTRENMRVYREMKSFALDGKTTAVVAGKARGMLSPVAIDGGLAVVSDKGRTVVSKQNGGTYVYAQGAELVVVRNGVEKRFSPVETKYTYLWTSLSPDGQKILFYAGAKGAYVCDLDGNLLADLGKYVAPKWMGNDWVVGMVDKDNGETITESTIFAVRADGAAYTALTDGSQICLYPSATADASKIVYNTADGKIRLMNVTIK